MFTNYRSLKAASRAEVANDKGAAVLTRTYYDKDTGQPAEPRVDILDAKYLLAEHASLVEKLRDLEALASDMAAALETTVAGLKVKAGVEHL